SIIHQQVVARLDGGKDLGMAQSDARVVARCRIDVEGEDLAGLDARLTALEGADAQFRTLKVGQYADRARELRFDLADRAMQLFQKLVRGMTHIDAENIRTRQEELFDHLRAGGGRPECRDDLDASIASHWD